MTVARSRYTNGTKLRAFDLSARLLLFEGVLPLEKGLLKDRLEGYDDALEGVR